MVEGFDKSLEPAYTRRPMRAVGRLFVGLAILLPVYAGAQNAGEGGAEVRPEREDAKRSDEAPPLDVEGMAALSPKEQQQKTEEMLLSMRDALRRVNDILADARASKDIVQLDCVNEKLTQIKGLLRVGEESSVKLYESMSSGATDVTVHEYTKISVAHQKVLVLRAEAEQCVGEQSVYTGDTEITVEVDEDIPSRDSTQPEPPPPGPEVPPIASKF